MRDTDAVNGRGRGVVSRETCCWRIARGTGVLEGGGRLFDTSPHGRGGPERSEGLGDIDGSQPDTRLRTPRENARASSRGAHHARTGCVRTRLTFQRPAICAAVFDH